jgi:tetratricopeptide (TPR) repeat protein
MEKMILVVFIALSSLLPARAAETSPEAMFQSANAAYQKGDYALARESYEQILRQGLGSPALYYNLGNAFHRLNQPGPARLWYERALREAPGDPDVRYNLAHMRSQLEEDDPGFSDALALRAPAILSGLLLLNAIFFVLLGISLFRENEILWWARWISALALAVGLVAAVAGAMARSRAYGVIMASGAEARAGPALQEPVSFVAPEGRRVAVFENLDEWTAVGLPEKGLKGWLAKTSVEIP